jgi:hypothetical protein
LHLEGYCCIGRRLTRLRGVASRRVRETLGIAASRHSRSPKAICSTIGKSDVEACCVTAEGIRCLPAYYTFMGCAVGQIGLSADGQRATETGPICVGMVPHK